MAKKKQATKKRTTKKRRAAGHWRIKILEWGGDGWHWHFSGKRVFEFASKAEASREIGRLRQHGGFLGAAEAVKIPAGRARPDGLLGNVED